MVLFAEVTSTVVADEMNLKKTFQDINTWVSFNLLALNFPKTQ
jgi:hypothetical protein